MAVFVSEQTREADEFERLHPRSRAAYERACGVVASGIAADSRDMTPFPIAIRRGLGARKWDIDGNEYIDYHFGSGALLLGHAHPDVLTAIQEDLHSGWHFAQPHPREAEWGEWIQRLMPSIERLAFTASGTEANMLALRLSRAYTGRPKILRFEGHYHGWVDVGVLGATPPFDAPSSPGIPANVARDYVAIPANDADLVARTLDADPSIGGVILEPSGASWGAVPLRPGFLQALREITAARGVVLHFDEVITGFRWSNGGAQERFAVRPDLTTLAKIATGGLPGGIVGGRAVIMAGLERSDDAVWNRSKHVRHGGTWNGNPVTAAAAIATLRLVSTGEPQRRAEELTTQLRSGINDAIKRLGVSAVAYGESSNFKVYIGPRPAGAPAGETPWTEDAGVLRGMSSQVIHGMRRALQNRGVDLMSSIAGMVSAVHSYADIDRTVKAFESAFEAVRSEQPELIPS